MSQTGEALFDSQEENKIGFKTKKRKCDFSDIEERLKLTEIALSVLKKRYLLKDQNGQVIETPFEMFHRVAHHIASAEKIWGATPAQTSKIERQFLETLINLDFVPNSPTFTGAGTRIGQLSACFVLPIEDSMEGIFQTIKDSALIHQSGGGTGFAFSRLRPRGSRVRSTTGVASGPVSFMRAYNAATETVKQGATRRGANMGILRVDHPDIEEFITCKKDGVSMTNFNISVAATDAFMEALERDTDYDLIDPQTQKPCGKKSAREVFSKITENAWLNGDPGMIFIDRINRLNPLRHAETIEATNPCVTGDTLVYTKEGLRQAKDLAQEANSIPMVTDSRQSLEKLSFATPMFKTGRKTVFRLQTEEGYFVRATKDHKIMTDAGWKKIKDLKVGDRIHILNRKGSFGNYGTLKIGRVLGWLLMNSPRYSAAATAPRSVILKDSLPFSSEKATRVRQSASSALLPVEETKALKIKKAVGSNALAEKSQLLPESVFSGSEEMQRGFLQAIFTSRGSINTETTKLSVTLTANSVEFLEKIQMLLLNFGVFSSLNGLELEIGANNLAQFSKEIGFASANKTETLNKAILSFRATKKEQFVAKVASIVKEGIEEVFDVIVPQTHQFIANGIVVHNCGEQPLPPYGTCDLGHINLSNFISGNDMDWPRLKETIRIGVRFLDNILDISKYPLAQVREQAQKTRRIGLGVMGFADALIKMGIAYNSDEGVAWGEKIMSFVNKEAILASEALAKERGNFPLFPGSAYDKDGRKYMRNGTVTTVAPTGTTSIFAGVSSGIEPLYAISFIRNQAELTMVDVNPLFEKIAKERGFYSEELMKKIAEEGSVARIEEIPEDIKRVFVTAHDITPKWHIKMQAAFQKHVDSSISKTINFPNEATEDDVRNAYILAYKENCKGITIYRDGSRTGQVLSTGKTNQTKKKVSEVEEKEEAASLESQPSLNLRTNIETAQEEFRIKPRPRPSVVAGTTEEIPTGLGQLFITINEDSFGPFEVFARIGKSGGEPAALTESVGRLISLALRSGIEIKSIIKHLKGIRGSAPVWQKGELILSVPDAIGKALERFIERKNTLGLNIENAAQKEESMVVINAENPKIQKETPQAVTMFPAPIEIKATKNDSIGHDIVIENDLCPECGGILDHGSGCLSCPSCGYSKC